MRDQETFRPGNVPSLAELVVRHTRRHMPTRRVAVESASLPAGVGGPGTLLLAALGTEFGAVLDPEDRPRMRRLLREARGGLGVPRIAVRHRLQTDVHGLDTSRHRVLREHGRVVIELDTHGRVEPQVLGAVMGAATLGATAREEMLRTLERALHPGASLGDVVGASAADVVLRRITTVGRGPITFPVRGPRVVNGQGDAVVDWTGVPAERRWAMEVLGLRADLELRSEDIHARFRRLVRRAHPDHGAETAGAAERIAELREARERLLAAATGPGPRR